MGVFVVAVPVLLVVVLGYAAGFTVAGWFGASPALSEGVGWATGGVLLLAVVTAAVRWRRRVRRRSG
ncbi:hypothetical protein [Blastococcus sp. TF02A-26]|uniref:hypothetical protein n=1 Tax=Blastococcus sp. TF02A-26 TaxID=2250577 RepID=UPI000DEB40E1|nr:hypothetical protein [Blastococcus sp. TF02A-26]RBY87407.1 hypothetical protein DQ240_07395 [Blastococcus sp. TF02A-26]